MVRVSGPSGGGVDEEFAAFVQASARSLRRTAYLVCGDWQLAEDAVQDALVKVYASWSRIVRKDQPGAYARRAVVRAVLDERRRPWRREDVGHNPTADRAEAHWYDPAAHVADRLLVLEALAALAPRQRAVVVLRYLDDLSLEQTAELLDISVGAVKSQAARGLATLRAELAARDALASTQEER